MTEFKIIEDNIINYNGNNQLYIMLIQAKGKYYFEINSRTCFIGRKAVKDFKTAELATSIIFRSLDKYKDIEKALYQIKLCLSMETFNEFIFLILALNSEIEFDEIHIMKMRFGFSSNPSPSVFNDYELTEISDVITVTFPNRKSSLGSFIAIDSKNSKYKFELNELYALNV